MKKICIVCGRAFESNYRRCKTCSPECRKLRQHKMKQDWEAKHRLRKLPLLKKCEICGAAFTPKNWNQKTCSQNCHLENLKQYAKTKKRRERKAVDVLRKCVVCGQTFHTTAGARKKTCSAECHRSLCKILARDWARRANGWANRVKICVVCGKEFSPACLKTLTCSPDCFREHRRRIRTKRIGKISKPRQPQLDSWLKYLRKLQATYGMDGGDVERVIMDWVRA